MKEWSLTHPYLTFSLVLVALLEAGAIVQMIVGLFKKPDPVTLNIKAAPAALPTPELDGGKTLN